jgi:hypothetical protein
LREQLLRALHAVGIQPPPASIGAVHALTTALMFLDNTFEEMRGRYLRGYGDVGAEAERVLDGVVSEMQELTRDFETFLTGVSDDVLRERLERLAPANPVANDLRELSRIIAEHGLVDLRPSLAILVDRALEDTFDVAVIGRVSSGKSSLLNALLGTPILPTGVLPVTAVPTRLRRGPEARLHIAYANGRTDTTTVDRIGDFVAESGNPRLEQTSRGLLSLHDRKPAVVDAALGAAAQAFAEGERPAHTATDALRADLVRSSHDVAAGVSRELETRAREVQAVLTDAANATGAPAPVFESLGPHRETPLLDVPPLSLDLKPPLWARANQHLLRRWITERVRDAWHPAVERAVDAYLDVLRRWATDGLPRAAPRRVR